MPWISFGSKPSNVSNRYAVRPSALAKFANIYEVFPLYTPSSAISPDIFSFYLIIYEAKREEAVHVTFMMLFIVSKAARQFFGIELILYLLYL